MESGKRQLKSYMGFTITKSTKDGDTLWEACDVEGHVYNSRKSLKDLKEKIYLDCQSRKLGMTMGRLLGIRR